MRARNPGLGPGTTSSGRAQDRIHQTRVARLRVFATLRPRTTVKPGHDRRLLPIVMATMTAALLALPATAQEYKIGISAGLTGYAATLDRSWRDGVEIAAATLNAKGGIMGRKLAVVVEDNRSEPPEAVTVYRKMISSDNVNVFISGCVSAGNFAAAAPVVRALMVRRSLQQPEHVKWRSARRRRLRG